MALSNDDREFLDDWFENLATILREIRDGLRPTINLPSIKTFLPVDTSPVPNVYPPPNTDPLSPSTTNPPQCSGGENYE